MHKRTVELELHEGQGEGSSLLLKAVDEAVTQDFGEILQPISLSDRPKVDAALDKE